MAALHPTLLFSLGVVSGLLTWSLVSALRATSPADVSPRPTLVAVAAATSSAAPAEAASTSSAAGSEIEKPAATRPADTGYRLWEALALRGAPTGNAGKWFTLPRLGGRSEFSSGFGPPSADAPLNPDFVEFFDLTPDEKDRLQALLRDTLRSQHEMDLARLTPIEPKFRVKQAFAVPGYATDAATLRATHDAELRAILGEARHQVYRDWAGDTFKRDFPGLAGMRREYHIIPTKQTSGAPEASGYEIVSITHPEGEKWGGGSSTYFFATLAEAENAAQLPLGRFFPAPGPDPSAPKSGEAAR